MYEFQYHRPNSLEDAAKLFDAAGDPQYLAGGQTLIPVMKQRLAMPSDLIDIGRIGDLHGITADKNALTIGAMTTHAQVASCDKVRESIPALASLANHIGDPAVRNRGTLGGSIANNDPAADYPAALVALGASVQTTSREIAAEAFFTGLFETALEEGEMIVKVTFPVTDCAGYEKFPNPASRYATVGVFVARTKERVRVAVTGAGLSVFRAGDIEAALETDFSPDALDGISISADGLNSDLHASAEYRANLIIVLARRAAAKANAA
ncbi:MAG: xanthine dehydrogenase family protein subunit M [Proteobacteria bacterium]|nr:xanthine dehydrogenase family protein subunit M [Pseudomonadota bacterium]